MKKTINPSLLFSIIAGLALLQPFSAFAAQHKAGGPAPGAKAHARPVSVRSTARAPVAHAPVARTSVARTPSIARAPASSVQHQAVNKNANTAARRTAITRTNHANPALTKRVATNRSIATPPSNAPAVQARGARTVRGNGNARTGRTQTAAVSTGANRGGQYTRANNYGGRWTAGNNHTDWNQGQEHDWDGHHYRWYDGGWLNIDGGFWPVPVYQAGGSKMAGAQQLLADGGYYNGPIDGIPGPGTRQAIANYQTDNNLPVTGHLNIPTQQSLGLD